jgi:tRNA pseudouridine55 synthase
VAGAPVPPGAEVLAGLAQFVGALEQVPPSFSAAKVTGQRAYDLARQGREVTLRPRTVEVHDIAVRRYDYPELEVEVRCGKGTYIRSLARDLGDALKCGAYVQSLRRTRVGPFGADEALTLGATAEEARARLLPPALAVSELPRVTLAPREVGRFRRGQAVHYPGGLPAQGEGDEVAVFDESGQLLAVAAVESGRGLLRPARVIA